MNPSRFSTTDPIRLWGIQLSTFVLILNAHELTLLPSHHYHHVSGSSLSVHQASPILLYVSILLPIALFQPRVISEVIGGPTAIGRIPGF